MTLAQSPVIRGNTYTIEGLKVPRIETEIEELRNELASIRTLLTATIEAVTRLDADVGLLVEYLGIKTP